jgi:hypothetical protein
MTPSLSRTSAWGIAHRLPMRNAPGNTPFAHHWRIRRVDFPQRWATWGTDNGALISVSLHVGGRRPASPGFASRTSVRRSGCVRRYCDRDGPLVPAAVADPGIRVRRTTGPTDPFCRVAAGAHLVAAEHQVPASWLRVAVGPAGRPPAPGFGRLPRPEAVKGLRAATCACGAAVGG